VIVITIVVTVLHSEAPHAGTFEDPGVTQPSAVLAVSMEPMFSPHSSVPAVSSRQRQGPLRLDRDPMPEAGTIDDRVRRLLEQGRILSVEMVAIQKEADERTERAKRRALAAIERRAHLRKRLEEP
jgi:hypothetical protein